MKHRGRDQFDEDQQPQGVGQTEGFVRFFARRTRLGTTRREGRI